MWGYTTLPIREGFARMQGDVGQTNRDFPIAFLGQDGLVVVNFGLLAGREATQAEIDRLADALRHAGAAPDMTITAARRQDFGRGIEAVSHQVHVDVRGAAVAAVEEVCSEWAVACADERSVDPLA